VKNPDITNENLPRKEKRASTVPTVHKLGFGCLRRRRDIEHLLLARVRYRRRFNANARIKVLSKEEIRDVATGYYGRLDRGDHGVEGVDVVETFIEFDRRECSRRRKDRSLSLCS
jgi:hypothetical protein